MSEEKNKGMKIPEKKIVPHYADPSLLDKQKPDIPKRSNTDPNDYPLFKKLDEIKAAIEEKENGVAHQLCRIADILEKKNVPTSAPLQTATPTSAPQPQPKSQSNRLEEINNMFPEDLATLLMFEDKGEFIKIAPRQFLGSENFAKIASVVREAGGEYVSAGKESHFRIPK